MEQKSKSPPLAARVSAIFAVNERDNRQKTAKTTKTQPQCRERLRDFARLVRSIAAYECVHIEVGAALAALDSRQRQMIEDNLAGPNLCSTWASDIARREVLSRGLVPTSWRAVVICHKCGPVWTPPEAQSCPWCFLRIADKWFPQPPVRCRDCRHFIPDIVNPGGGLGDCTATGRREGLCFPYSLKTCRAWRPSDSTNT